MDSNKTQDEKFVKNERQPSENSLEGEDLKTLERRVLRKVDIRLLPILAALYCIALVDRTNISVARISGLDEDLDLTVGNRASVALLVFFVGYVIFEIPSNIVIRKVGPAKWLGLIGVLWGIVSLCIGFLQSWIQLAVLRAILGAFEAVSVCRVTLLLNF